MRLTPTTPLAIAAALLAAACARAPQPAPSAALSGPYAATGMGDAGACRPDGFLVVHNGERYPIRLVGRPSTSGPSAQGTLESQELGPLAAGRTDTLVDLRSELRIVEALPNVAHAVHPSELQATNAPPVNRPQHVSFACARPPRGGE